MPAGDCADICTIKLIKQLNKNSMKKLFFSTAVAAVLTLSMSSCKKDYVCDCKDSTTSEQFETTSYPNTKLIDAQKACKDRQSVWQNTTKPSAVCTIL
jgi:hypothetical protein